MDEDTTQKKMAFYHFHPAHLLFVIVLALGAMEPAAFGETIASVTQWFGQSLGWMVLLVCAFFIGVCAYLAFSRYGHVRLGGQDERPEFGQLAWFAMLFAAGIGVGLVFYGSAEPFLHFVKPPPSMHEITESAEHARRAMAITYFHWGLHAWAIYAVAAISVAYFAFHRQTPLLPSVAITHNRFGRAAIDSFAVLAVVFGLVSSLSQGVLQVSEGIAFYMPSLGSNSALSFIVLSALFVCYMISASTGIGKGIKILSYINIALAILVMLFVLIAGPTAYIMESWVSGIGDYLDQFIHLSFNARQYSDMSGWTENWTITYLLWWISWGPFVGVFIARISKGRTIKEFMLGIILVPTAFSTLWFATLGGSAIYAEMHNVDFTAQVSALQTTTYAVLETLPLAEITPLIVVLLLFIFLVTSADSGTYVLSMFTRHGEHTPPVRERLFWGMVIGGVTTGALMLGGGVGFFRSIAVFGAIPFLFIMLWQCYGLLKALKQDWTAEHAD